MKKTYIGDGVYAAFDGYGLWLTTENGIQTTNSIYLEPEVLRALDEFRKACAERATACQPEAKG